MLDHLHRNHSINSLQAFMLIRMQKINFITNFFHKILQRNSKLVTLGNLGMPGHTHLKWWYQFEETFDVYLQAKQLTSSFTFSLRYCKDIINLLFWEKKAVSYYLNWTDVQTDDTEIQKEYMLSVLKVSSRA